MSDRYLDGENQGPMFLKDPIAANVVQEAIVFGAVERYDLFAWCVMANHVHVVLKPRWKLSKITQGLKGYTAYKINQIQGDKGRVFWQDESFDHWVRDEESLLRIVEYVEMNPVAAGLCARSQDWAWSSARLRENWSAGEPLVIAESNMRLESPAGFASTLK